MLNKKLFLISLLVTAFIFTALGYVISSVLVSQKMSDCGKLYEEQSSLLAKTVVEEEKDENDTFLAGWQAAEKRLIDNGVTTVSYDEGAKRQSLLGIIKSIDNNEITVEVAGGHPLMDSKYKNRKIEINKETKIIAIENFNDQEPEEMKIDDLKEGVNVFVVTGEEFLIVSDDKIIAQQIGIQAMKN